MRRRGFLRRLVVLAGVSTTAMTLAPLLIARDAHAAVDPADPRIHSEVVNYPALTGLVRALLVRPKDTTRYPAVVVVHENLGLTRHIEDVARRMALEGFVVLAPDLLTPLGGTPAKADRARDRLARLNPLQAVANAVAAVVWLKGRDDVAGRIGAAGFDWGGGIVNQMAVNSPDLTAAVAFYGEQPETADVPRIRAKMMLHYATVDDRINAGIPAFEAALEVSNISFVKHQYDKTQHGFHNDSAGMRYNRDAAALAWRRTIQFFNENLKG